MKKRSRLVISFWLLFLLVGNNFSQTGNALTLSEIMFYPSETNGEFIEIYNTSTTETIDLSTIRFKYSTASNNSFVAFIGGTNLGPGKYAVVLQGNYDYNNGSYKNIIPAGTMVLKLSTNNFGSSGMANTTSRDVFLINASGTTIDTYTYSADNNSGISDEKFLMTKDNSASNWRNSIRANGTPGFRNSVTPVQYLNDLSIRLAGITSANPVEGDSVQFSCVVKNIGAYDAGAFNVDFYIDQNADSIGQASEKFFSKSFSELFASDSLFVTSKFYAGRPGKMIIIAGVDYANDENTANNKIVTSVNVSEKPAQYSEIVLNEIMYAPSNDEPEWIELFNRSNRQVNLKNWKVSDNTTLSTIISSDYLLNPGEYVVISGDATISNYYSHPIKTIIKTLPSLANSGDYVILKSSTNTTIDSTKYLPSWGGGTGGFSLERISSSGSSIDPANWKSSVSKFKATPGAVNSVTQKNYDLQVKNFTTSSSYAELGKNIQFTCVVTNLGLTNASNYVVKLFRDVNADAVLDASEQIAQLSGSNLANNATASFSFSTNNFVAGKNQFYIRVDYDNDEFTENNLASITIPGVVINETKGDIVVNEIMYKPLSNESDWLEIFNTSRKAINLKGYQLGNGTIKNKIIAKDIILQPSEYFLIIRDSLKYPYSVKPAKWVMTSFPVLTDNKCKVVLLDSLNRSIDSLEYKSSWGGGGGKSLERIEFISSSTDSTNWKTSTSRFNATPGAINSVAPKNYDVYVKSFSYQAPYAEVGKNIFLAAAITNNGRYDVQNFVIRLYHDLNYDGIAQPAELISEQAGSNLAIGTTAAFNLSVNNIQPGQNQFIVNVEYNQDEYPENNSAILKVNGVVINEVKGDLIINELAYSTRYVSQQWIELYNKSRKTINLNGYQILSGTKKSKVISKNIFINPDSYIVIARDSSVFNYNSKLTSVQISGFNSLAGKIAIQDSLNRTIDSLEYKTSWGGAGTKSLERIDPEKSSTDSTNWKTSISKFGGTPGSINSVSEKNYDLQIKNIFTPAPFAEIGKNFPIIATVFNNGKIALANYTVKLFRDANVNGVEDPGELLVELPGTNLIPGSSANFSFSTNNFSAGLNQFIVKVDLTNDEFPENNYGLLKINGYVINETRGDIVVNEFMYTPATFEPEWIELFNKSQKQININGYQFGNGYIKNRIISNELILKPNEYAVITRDSSIISKFPGIKKFRQANFPDLNNTKGKIIVLDSLNRTIDSLDYKSTWGGGPGKSIERVEAIKSSTDSTNWKTTTSKFSGTPGTINSVSPKDNDLYLKSFSTASAYAEIGKNISLSASVTNGGRLIAQSYTVKLFRDSNNNGIGEAGEQIGELAGSNLAVGATADFNFSTNSSIAGSNQFIVRIDFTNDEFTENNQLSLKVNGIIINENKGDLVINEILYSSNSVFQQWIEIYNRSQKIINLKGYQIFSGGKKNKIISGDILIKPSDYFVVARDTSVYRYNSKLTQLAVTDFPTLTGKLAIADSLNRTIDSLEFKTSWGGASGKSLERIDPSKPSTDSTNWKTSTSKYNGTPGGINSLAQKNYDLNLQKFSLATSYAEVGKNTPLVVVITNNGKSIIQNYSVKLFKDSNANGIGDPAELISEQTGSEIIPGATANFSFSTNNIQPGQNQFLVKIDFAGDEYLENNTAILKVNGVIINEAKGDLVINELMYSSRFVSQQWLEIYNRSQKTVNLNGYQLLSGTKKNKIISKNILLAPDKYFVIARDSSVFNFNPKLNAALIADFTSFTGKVAIVDSLNRTIDSLEFKNSWGGNNGKSLERIDAAKTSVDSINWKTSVNNLGATPGLVNSVSKKNNDIVVQNISFNPPAPSIGQKVRVRADISNIGRNNSAFKLILSKVNKDGSKTKVEETNTLSLSNDASLSYEFTYAIENIAVKTTYECYAVFDLDEDLSNNVLTGSIVPGYLAGSVLINEIMYNPLNGEPEWIELFNNSGYEIDLEDWSVSDVFTTPQKIKINAKDYSFPKNSYLVIAKDSTIKNYHGSIPSKLIISSFPSLNNDIDGVVIKDARSSTIDSVLYDSKWGGENGKSLERKSITSPSNDKTNWASSIDVELSTPGRLNSNAIKKYDLIAKAIVSNPLYPVYNEDVNIGLKIYNNGTESASNFSIRFFTKENNKLTQFASSQIPMLNSHDSMFVYSSSKIKLPTSKTFVGKIIFPADEDTLNNLTTADISPGTKPNSILISEVMYSPLAGDPEWIEFVNASNEPINLKNWSISDLYPSPTKAYLTTKDDFIQPGEYAIATPDTHKYPFTPPKKFYQAKFGALGNSNDGIIIYDFRNAIIDSLNYKSTWGGGNGYSLERISLTKATNDSTNWMTSLAYYGASGGTKNSVASLVKYSRNALVVNEIMYEPENGKAEFIELYNSTNDTIQVGGLQLKVGDKTKVSLALQSFKVAPKQYFITASDSSIYKSYPLLVNSGKVSVSPLLNLPNEGASLIVKDAFGTTLDSLVYSSLWHNRNMLVTKNKSLERINPMLGANDHSNWSTSVAREGATPAKANSIFTENLSGNSAVNINPNPFSPDNDGFEDFTIISFNLPYRLSQVRIKVFDSQGRLVRTLLENQPSGANSSVIFNGFDDEGRSLRMGIYILLIEISAEGSNNIETIKTPIVIARKLN